MPYCAEKKIREIAKKCANAMRAEIHVTVIYSRTILVAMTSEYRIKRVICKTWTVTFANSADPDQTPQKAVSDQSLHCLLKLQEVKG